MTANYVTKIWIGNHWWYIRTKEKLPFRSFHYHFIKFGVISYKISDEDWDKNKDKEED